MKCDTEETQTLTLSEYELHGIICGLTSFYLNDDGLYSVVQAFKIVLDDAEQFTPELAKKWEQKMNGLIQTLQSIDVEWHADALQTC